MASQEKQPPGTRTNWQVGSAWTNIDNIMALDAAYATVTGAGPSAGYILSNWGFAIPSNSIITGVKAVVTAHANAADIPFYPSLCLTGGPASSPKTMILGTTPGGTLTFGGASDLWGVGPTPAIVNAAAFGITVICDPDASTVSVDGVVMTVYYEENFLTGIPLHRMRRGFRSLRITR